MKRFAILIALAAVILATTAAAPAAPRWPSASLAYWQEAETLLSDLTTHSEAVFVAVGKPDVSAVISSTVTALNETGTAIAALEPPPALLPVHTRLGYAAAQCYLAIGSAKNITNDFSATATLPIFVSFAIECRRAINETRVEAARYAATVGGFPAASN